MRSLYWSCLFVLLFAGCTQPPAGPAIGTESWYPTKIAYSANGSFLAIAQSSLITICRTSDNSIFAIVTPACRGFDDFTWMPDGGLVTIQSELSTACNATNYTLTFWDEGAQTPLHAIVLDMERAAGTSPTLAASPNGQIALAYEAYNRDADIYFDGVYVVDSSSYRFLKNITTDSFAEISYSPDGKYFYVGAMRASEDMMTYTFYSTDDYSVVYSINMTTNPASQLTWSQDGKTMAGLTKVDWNRNNITFFSVSRDDDSFQLIPAGSYSIDAAGSPSAGYESIIDSMKFSPNGRYVAIGGSYSISACPDVPGICNLGFVETFDMQGKKVVFWDGGGNSRANTGRFDWSPDSKLAYMFNGETPGKLRIINAANFTGPQGD